MSTPGKPLFNRVALIGVGLIGASVAHAAKRGKLAGHIAGFTPDAGERARAAKIGFADSLPETMGEAVRDADLVILAAPVGAFGDIAKEIAPHLKNGAIVSDTGSVKGAVVRDVAPHMPDGVHLI
ncbi:MAG TPA: prephenate dehydrogenase/arogenate dehydrogenase family protein, partial [Rhizomicrobium sp.]|nr:prephenate dehydrogenase/arogenate dehydrogenase family protein [Rhizomicrobium sp.]